MNVQRLLTLLCLLVILSGTGLPVLQAEATTIVVTTTNANPVVVTNSAPVDLFAISGPSPAGGTFSGVGVSNNQFDPAGLPLGLYTTLYTVADGFGITNVSAIVVAVGEIPRLVVTTTNDVINPVDDQISLREALAYAAHLPPPRVITFSDNTLNGAENFHDGGSRTIILYTNLTATTHVTINGPGARYLAISGNQQTRILDIDPGVHMTNNALTFTQGVVTNFILHNPRSGGITARGGGSGTLTINECVFSHNTSRDAGGAIQTGMGVWLRVFNSTFYHNETLVGDGGAIASGGNSAEIRQSTFSRNKAGGNGGAIRGSESMRVHYNTFYENEAGGDSASLHPMGTMASHNIFYSTSGWPNVEDGSDPFLSLGFNIDNTTRGSVTTGDLFANPLLGPLGYWGGPTPTHKLLPGSPAINAGCLTSCGYNEVDAYAIPAPSSTDQRGAGFPRIWGGRIDIGAFELFAPPTFAQNTITVMVGSAPFNLYTATGPSPTNGVFSGTGVDSETGIFDPALFPVGVFSVTYAVADDFGVTNAASVTINVTELPSLIVTTTSAAIDNLDGQTSLREALAYAATLSGPQTILFSSNTLNGAVNFHDGTPRTITVGSPGLVINSDLTVQGPGDHLLTISGNNQTRVLDIGAVETTFSGLTIANGLVSGGGHNAGAGIRLIGGTLTLTDSTLRNNTVQGGSHNQGAGLYATNATVNLAHVNVLTNAVHSGPNNAGAGLFIDHSTLTASNATFNANTITGGNFTQNQGAGLFAQDSTAQVFNATFAANALIGQNDSVNRGGGLSVLRGALTLRNSVLYSNTVHGAEHSFNTGAGMAVVDAAGDIRNTTISTNRLTGTDWATNVGGGMYSWGGTTDVHHVTMSGNSVSGPHVNLGGHIHQPSPNVLNISHTIAHRGGAAGPNYTLEATLNSFGYNISDDGTGPDGPTDLRNTNPMLGPLADNGGLTLTHALLPGSPAINAGNPAFDPFAVSPPMTTDQRGFRRVNDGRIDIGAFELIDLFQFQVLTAHGVSSPAAGTYLIEAGTVLTNTITSSVTVGTTQYVAMGYTLTGHTPPSGQGTVYIFTITNNTVFTWVWSTQYWLRVTSGPHGSVNVTDNWQDAGSIVNITALPDPYYAFDQWSGDATGDANPLSLLMDEAKAVEASFSAIYTINHPTPLWWLASFGITNDFENAVGEDPDGDKVVTWKEYIMDTDPTDGTSYLRFTNITPVVAGPDRGLRFAWPVSTARVYAVQYSTNLLNETAWQPYNGMTNIVPTGAELSITNWFNGENNRHLRLNVSIP